MSVKVEKNTPVQKSNESDIEKLDSIDAIRKLPGMYIGELGPRCIIQLMMEAVGNVLDLYGEKAASGTEVLIDLETNDIQVKDDGYGMPVGKIMDIMTETHTSGKFSNRGKSIGMHGVGITCVNALSSKCRVHVSRDGFEHTVEFAKGRVTKKLRKGKATTATGTAITFNPDLSIIGECEIPYEEIATTLEKLSYLAKGFSIKLKVVKGKEVLIDKHYKSEAGLSDYIKVVETNPLLKDAIVIEKDSEDNTKELTAVINYSKKRDGELCLSFVNYMVTMLHGKHVEAFRSGFAFVVKKYIETNNMIPKKDKLEVTTEDVFDGISVLLELKTNTPQFDSQSKHRYTNSDSYTFIRSTIVDVMTNYMNQDKNNAKTICNKVILNAKARRSAANAKILSKKKSDNSFTSISSLSKFTKAATKNPDLAELFIVEGSSAGGSAAQGRDTDTQAIYRLRGKPLNTTELNIAKILGNKELNDIINILGTSCSKNFDIEKINYKKIVIMADADVDGSHIAALMISFFYTHMKEIIEHGYLYCALPPLYRIKENGKDRYIKDKEEYNNLILDRITSRYVLATSTGGKNKALTPEALNSILRSTTRYVNDIKNLAHKYAVDASLLEFLLLNKDNQDLITDIPLKFPVLTVKKTKAGLYIDGLIDGNYQSLLVNDVLYQDIEVLNYALAQFKGTTLRYKLVDEVRYTDTTLYEFIQMTNNKVTPSHLTRFKGLGEMDANVLYETTMDPEHRNLIKVTIDDAEQAETKVKELMGKNADFRKAFMATYEIDVNDLDG